MNPIQGNLRVLTRNCHRSKTYPVGIGPGWLTTNQRAISPIANTTTINTPVQSPHARQLTIHAREPALMLHNFRGTLSASHWAHI